MNKKIVFLISTLILMLLNAGCAMVWTGHRFDLSKTESIKTGKTSRADIVNLYGSPHNVIKKHEEKMTVYVYKYMRNTAIAIPFFLSLGKTKVNGYQINVVISDETDKVLNYELLRFEETL